MDPNLNPKVSSLNVVGNVIMQITVYCSIIASEKIGISVSQSHDSNTVHQKARQLFPIQLLDATCLALKITGIIFIPAILALKQHLFNDDMPSKLHFVVYIEIMLLMT